MKKIIPYFLYSLLLWMGGCEDFLDEKSNKSFLIPTTLDDFQRLLDNDLTLMNVAPAMGLIGTDDYYISDPVWDNLNTQIERHGYLWLAEDMDFFTPSDWIIPHRQVFTANVVLEGLETNAPTARELQRWQEIKGAAHFYRGLAWYHLLSVFAAPYGEENFHKPGIPLRYSADVNLPVRREPLEASYQACLSEFAVAAELLPNYTAFATRPSRAAAFGMLARMHLLTQEYEQALAYTDSALHYHHHLIDYNTLNPAAGAPFTLMNQEVLYHTALQSFGIIGTHSRIPPDLYASYADDDLRKVLFFNQMADGTFRFKGSYSGNINRLFGGIATDELMLNRAECLARLGEVEASLASLNDLLVTRWATGTFEPYQAETVEEALDIVLSERRKEMIFRATRWVDLRRLNREPSLATTLIRNFRGEVYTLPPNSTRYVYSIPWEEISLSGMVQNIRE